MAETGEVSMANLEETLKEINEAKGDRVKLMDAVQKLRGIGPAKAPFISHMLGFGGDITLDAVEINYWLTGKGNVKAAPEPKQAFVDAVKHDEGSQAILKNRIVKRLMEVREKSPEAAAIPEDAYLHVMHHWLWDKAKGTETTHEGVYKAAQEFMPSKGEEDEQHHSVTQRHHPESGQFMPSKFWMDKAGRVKSTDDHAKEFAKPGEKIDNDNREIYSSRGLAAGSLRAQVVDDTLWLEGQAENFSHLPKAQRHAIMDMAMDRGLAVNYNYRFIEPESAFMPSKEQRELAEAERGYSAIGHEGGTGSRTWMFDPANRSVKDTDADETHAEKWGDKVYKNFRGRYDAGKHKVSVAFPDRELDKLEGRKPTADDVPSGVYNALKRKYGDDVDVLAFMPAKEHHSASQPRHPDNGQFVVARNSSFTTDDFKPVKRNGTLVVPVVRKDKNQHLSVIE